MRFRRAIALAVAVAGWFAVPAQQALPPFSFDSVLVGGAMRKVAERSKSLGQMLNQLQPADWVAHGAPGVYADQVQSIRQQNVAVETEMTALAANPSHLQDGIRAVNRLETFSRSLTSLLGGVRRYQSQALGDEIDSTVAAGQSDIEVLEQYLVDLAGEKEQLLAVTDHEAQRCRASLAIQPQNNRKTNR